MKTFKQFLNEADPKSYDNEVRTMIERDCGQFIRDSDRNGFLFRGIKHSHLSGDLHVTDSEGNKLVYIRKTVRSDREPRDMSSETHRTLNAWFDDKFGFKARTEGLFAFGENSSSEIIEEYGDPHIIFPIGEFQYVWSVNISDLYVDLQGEELDEGEPADIIEWLNKQEYRKTGLDSAVRNECEIMIKCDKYYAFPIEYEEELKKSLGFK